MNTLQSKDNPRIRQLAKLSESPREARKQSLALLDGVHLLQALLESGKHPLWGVFTASAMQREEICQALKLSEARGTEWFEIPDKLMLGIAPTEHPSGILAVWPFVSNHDQGQNQSMPKDACVLMLEEIQDPGNLGTLLRSAQAAGIQYVALSEGCAEPWAPKVLRAAMGAHFYLSLLEKSNLIKLAQFRQPTYAACSEAHLSAWEGPLSEARGIVIGNEGSGISPALREACYATIAIPMATGCESLNAAIAGSLLMFERRRQLARIASQP